MSESNTNTANKIMNNDETKIDQGESFEEVKPSAPPVDDSSSQPDQTNGESIETKKTFVDVNSSSNNNDNQTKTQQSIDTNNKDNNEKNEKESKPKRNWDQTDCLIATSPPDGGTVLILSRERCARDQSGWETAERGAGVLQTAGLVFGIGAAIVGGVAAAPAVAVGATVVGGTALGIKAVGASKRAIDNATARKGSAKQNMKNACERCGDPVGQKRFGFSVGSARFHCIACGEKTGFERTVCNNCCLEHFTLMIDTFPKSLDGTSPARDESIDETDRYRMVEVGTTCVDCVLAESMHLGEQCTEVTPVSFGQMHTPSRALYIIRHPEAHRPLIVTKAWLLSIGVDLGSTTALGVIGDFFTGALSLDQFLAKRRVRRFNQPKTDEKTKPKPTEKPQNK